MGVRAHKLPLESTLSNSVEILMVASSPHPIDSSQARVAPHAARHRLRRAIPGYWQLLKQSTSDWLEDRAMRLAASLAFYTMLSLAPLLVLAIKIVGRLFGQDFARDQVKAYANQWMGPKAASAVSGMLSYNLGHGLLATSISAVVLIVSASAVFGELQDSLNTIWEVKPKPGRGLWGIIQDRFLSFVLVLGSCFLLLVSLIVSTILAAVTGHGHHQGITWETFNFVVSIAVITILFALIFKYLPDVKVRWRDVWVGAIATAVLFTIGKFLLGWYLGRAASTSIYGTAGSVMAVLLWVYYSAQILFFGAELTQAYAHQTRDRVRPTENAVPVTEQERSQQGMPSTDHVEAATRREESKSAAPSNGQARAV